MFWQNVHKTKADARGTMVEGGDNVPNLRTIMSKLQKALLLKGCVVSINTSQWYSADQGRMVTKITLRSADADPFETYSRAEAVRYLADKYAEVCSNEADA